MWEERLIAVLRDQMTPISTESSIDELWTWRQQDDDAVISYCSWGQRYEFHYEGVHYQTTIGAAGSQENARLICKECYQKCKEGCPKEEILEFRNRRYAELAQTVTNSDQRIQKRPAADELVPRSMRSRKVS